MSAPRAWSRLLTVVFVAACAGCLGDPMPPDGVVKCHPRDNACPEYYQCVSGTCYQSAHLADGGFPDGGNCNDYCNCIGLSCSTVPGAFADEGTCLKTCKGLSPAAFGCRIYHCRLANSDPAIHCAHALGQNTCP